MKSRILFLLGSLLVICNSHAQSLSEPLMADASLKNSTAACKALDAYLLDTYIDSYSGGCKDGLAHGEGVAERKDYKYRGMFLAGKFHGKGTLTDTDQDGAIYVGDFVAGKFHGKGTLTGQEGKYVGDFVAGNLHGKGTFTLPSGDKYVGDFVDGKFQGRIKASGDAGSLFSLAGNPLLTPDSNDYKGDVRIDANENSLIRVQSELMGIQERRNPRYVYLKLTKRTINHAPNSMRIGATISVIGKYVKNINYRTVGGETKTAPVIECSYLGEANGEESKGMLKQMIKQRESR